MKLTMRIGAAVGIAALAACSQSGQDNSATAEAAAGAPSAEDNTPEATGPSDTLGNQLNQLNDSDATESESTNSN